MTEAPQAPPKKKRYWLIGIGAALTLILVGGVGWWLMLDGKAPVPGLSSLPVPDFGKVPVPDLKDKPVDEAHKLIKDAKLRFADEETQMDGTPAGTVIGQVPAAGSKVKPCSTIKIQIAVGLKPASRLDVSGPWDSSNDFRYDVIQDGNDFFWRMTQWPRQEPPEERGSGSISNDEITAQTGESKSAAGARILFQDEKGLAQVIKWDNGAIWFRTEADGAELVRHYKLEKYDRARILEAIQKKRQAESDC
jgi:PASTA domain-containing protein